MIRKPPAGWQRPTESAAVRTVRTTAAVAKGSATVARQGVHVLRGLVCYFFAAIWGFLALTPGIMGSLPTFFGLGAISATMVWLGTRAFARARAG